MRCLKDLVKLTVPHVSWGSWRTLPSVLQAQTVQTWPCYHCLQLRTTSSDNGPRPTQRKQSGLSYRLIKETGKVSPTRSVPPHIQMPSYCNLSGRIFELIGLKQKNTPEIKSEKQIAGMRDAARVAKEVLLKAAEAINIGVTTEEIDRVVHTTCISLGAYPSPLGYKGFPKSVCTSVNNVACHGIPDDSSLEDGDIINVDVTVYYNGYHGDLSETYLVGDVDQEAKFLVDVARQCRDAAIALLRPGLRFSEIGRIIESTATSSNLSVIPHFCGHGIGDYFHGPPDIYHFDNDEPGRMQEGITFTVEPVLSPGSGDICILEDGWTAVSVDHSRSAQFEHTVLITQHGVDVLTQ